MTTLGPGDPGDEDDGKTHWLFENGTEVVFAAGRRSEALKSSNDRVDPLLLELSYPPETPTT